MTIMHVWQYDTMEARGWGYMKNVSTFFKDVTHVLYIVDCPAEVKRDLDENVITVCELKSDSCKHRLMTFRKSLCGCSKVILHGLRKGSKGIYKELTRSNGYEIIWVVWGHEVYNDYYSIQGWNFKHPARTISSKVYGYYFRKIVRQTSTIIGEKQDCERACKLLNFDGKRVDYNFGGYADLEIPSFEIEEKAYKCILVGHNAYPDCRHLECFRLIKKMDDGKLVVICPLPYEGEEPCLVHEIREQGVKLFGERFHGIYLRQNYIEYCEMLSKCDIALFNHTRQMAQGNVEKLLYYGKKIYFSAENTNYELYRDLGANVYQISEINQESFFEPLNEREQEQNRIIIQKQLLPDTFIETWNRAIGEE